MTDKEFKRLSREELVEIIYELQRSEASLREENDQLRGKLADRSLKLEKAGSLAEASLALNGVFEAAQSAADQYLAAIRDAREEAREKAAQAQAELGEIQGQRQEILDKARQEAEGILSDAQAQAQKLTEDAQAQVERKWETFQENTQKLIAMHAELQSLLQRN